VQERGLYFWSEYDSKYTPLLAMNDPGEKDRMARSFTQTRQRNVHLTGIAFFRQLPEGRARGVSPFVNLLAASRPTLTYNCLRQDFSANLTERWGARNACRARGISMV